MILHQRPLLSVISTCLLVVLAFARLMSGKLLCIVVFVLKVNRLWHFSTEIRLIVKTQLFKTETKTKALKFTTKTRTLLSQDRERDFQNQVSRQRPTILTETGFCWIMLRNHLVDLIMDESCTMECCDCFRLYVMMQYYNGFHELCLCLCFMRKRFSTGLILLDEFILSSYQM